MILACGEALIDLFIFDRMGSRLACEAVAGGSPFNVAIGLARLGRRVGFFGGLSTDSFGEFLASVLKDEGVDLSSAPRKSNLTTISVVATDGSGHPRYSFHGEQAADRMITAADLPHPLPPNIEALTFGSFSLAVEPAASAYLALASRETSHRVISIDPNIRPTVIGDLTDYDRQLMKFIRTASVVKASQEDVALLYGADAAISAVAQLWLREGPALVVITRGSEGAIAFQQHHSIEMPGYTVNVIDTVGAGDSFHAALLANLAETGDLTPARIKNLPVDRLKLALQYAVAASSITCSRRGADLPTRKEVDAQVHQ
jgi:fructokinase